MAGSVELSVHAFSLQERKYQKLGTHLPTLYTGLCVTLCICDSGQREE